jgi:hypothetical protein
MDQIVKEWIADRATPATATTEGALKLFDAWCDRRNGTIAGSGMSAKQFAWVLKRCALRNGGGAKRQWVLKWAREI